MIGLANVLPAVEPQRDDTGGPGTGRPTEDVIDLKARELLNMSGQEFRRAWYAGRFAVDDRPETVAMNRLMRQGFWPTDS